MNPLNSVIVEGTLKEFTGKDEYNMGTFTLATNHKYRAADGSFKEESSSFIVECWGQLYKFMSDQYTVRGDGMGVRVVGRMKQQRWTESGRTHSRIVIVAEHIEIKPCPEKDTDDVKQVDTTE